MTFGKHCTEKYPWGYREERGWCYIRQAHFFRDDMWESSRQTTSHWLFPTAFFPANMITSAFDETTNRHLENIPLNNFIEDIGKNVGGVIYGRLISLGMICGKVLGRRH